MGKVISLEARRAEKQKKQIVYKNTVDYPLVVALFALLTIGLIMVFSSSYYAAEFRGSLTDGGDPVYYFKKQLFSVVLGIGALLLLSFIDYHNYAELKEEKFRWLGRLRKIRPYWVILVLSILSLLLVWTPLGVSVNGSRRWINVGISIQPSEIVKFGVIIFMACSIGRKPRRMTSFLSGVLPYLLMVIVIAIPMYFMPNFSAVCCIGILVMAILLVGGARMWHWLAVGAVCVLALVLVVKLEAYREDRIAALGDPLQSYQLKQSMFSLGTGGLFGKGLGNSLQKLLWLPMGESDFIFAIICEELGFVGATVVLVMFGIIIWRGVVIALRAPDITGFLLSSGVVAIFTIQVILNIAVVTGLCPPTGVVLPFVSYGGSSVIVFMAMMGLLLNVSRQQVSREAFDEKREGRRKRMKSAEAPQKQGKKPARGRRISTKPQSDWDI